MWMIDTNPSKVTESVMADDVTEMTSMISKHDQQKMNWEKKEEENVQKENVHYQDVLFDGEYISLLYWLMEVFVLESRNIGTILKR